MAHASLDSGGMGRTVWRRMMEDVKWLSEKWGLPILILLVTVIAGIICLGKLHTEEKKVAEEVWEPPVEIEDSETVTSIDSAYWFISQSSDCLISEEEKEQQNMVLSAAESVKKLGQQSCRGYSDALYV